MLAFFFPRKSGIERGTTTLCIDYRLVIAGALLPDIIDKPLGFWLAPDLVSHSLRSVGHTAAFGLLLLLASLMVLWLRGGLGLLVLSLSSTGHLLLDQMWQLPAILLWPTRGWAFPQGTTALSEWVMFHFRSVSTSTPEVLGGVVLLAFAINLYRRHALFRFLKSGAIH